MRVRASCIMITISIRFKYQAFTFNSAAAAVDWRVRRWTTEHRVCSDESSGPLGYDAFSKISSALLFISILS